MVDDLANRLKELAQHRGLKLVKSRRRKAGTGDFGMFGLINDQGKELIGFGDEGRLTATAQEIESYLRANVMSNWKQSANATPNSRAARAKRDPTPEREAEPAIRPHSRRGTAAKAPPKTIATDGILNSSNLGAGGGKTSAPPSPRAKPKHKINRSEPVLALRAARPKDAEAIAKLFSQLPGIRPDPKEVTRNLISLRKAGGDMYLADFGIVAGCIAWSVIATPHRGDVGRITVLVVDEGHRRRGFGAKLLTVAEAALLKKGCTTLEVLSDIEIRNSHNFLRSRNFDQTSYRFARAIEKPSKGRKQKGLAGPGPIEREPR